jgi:hypothetical protein
MLRGHRRQGNYAIKDIPPGSYTVEVWQEKLGAADEKAHVKDGASSSVNFSLKPMS